MGKTPFFQSALSDDCTTNSFNSNCLCPMPHIMMLVCLCVQEQFPTVPAVWYTGHTGTPPLQPRCHHPQQWGQSPRPHTYNTLIISQVILHLYKYYKIYKTTHIIALWLEPLLIQERIKPHKLQQHVFFRVTTFLPSWNQKTMAVLWICWNRP